MCTAVVLLYVCDCCCAELLLMVVAGKTRGRCFFLLRCSRSVSSSCSCSNEKVLMPYTGGNVSNRQIATLLIITRSTLAVVECTYFWCSSYHMEMLPVHHSTLPRHAHNTHLILLWSTVHHTYIHHSNGQCRFRSATGGTVAVPLVAFSLPSDRVQRHRHPQKAKKQ